MAEGELFRDLMRDEGDLAHMVENNRQVGGELLVQMYVYAESWARTKGLKLEDVEITRQEMSPDGEHIFFAFDETEESKRKNHGGLLGPNGLPVRMSL